MDFLGFNSPPAGWRRMVQNNISISAEREKHNRQGLLRYTNVAQHMTTLVSSVLPLPGNVETHTLYMGPKDPNWVILFLLMWASKYSSFVGHLDILYFYCLGSYYIKSNDRSGQHFYIGRAIHLSNIQRFNWETPETDVSQSSEQNLSPQVSLQPPILW